MPVLHQSVAEILDNSESVLVPVHLIVLKPIAVQGCRRVVPAQSIMLDQKAGLSKKIDQLRRRARPSIEYSGNGSLQILTRVWFHFDLNECVFSFNDTIYAAH